jgi:hypothetical protein
MGLNAFFNLYFPDRSLPWATLLLVNTGFVLELILLGSTLANSPSRAKEL